MPENNVNEMWIICKGCRSRKHVDDDFAIVKGRKLKTCNTCRARKQLSQQKNKCPHERRRSQCKECNGSGICKHERQKHQCKECNGSSICKHEKHKADCKICTDPVTVTINNMYANSKKADKKHNRYNETTFITKPQIKQLIETYPNCIHCNIRVQYNIYDSTLGTIERLDNTIQHQYNNCAVACLSCNSKKLTNKK